ncbi:hypothetical protein KVR01_004614 [Diaporthe batatas]|uniref:uncharacterized protein n=1 Tax=Diaporthe batatas TaxID=748121 RepID=UPI001D046AA2|nr:uncharacterized protein KVR01_004614 [Diaporthe batatas]KAG8166062.1 hypothetical protein KVR01_004614 [Diaporthe batatas]
MPRPTRSRAAASRRADSSSDAAAPLPPTTEAPIRSDSTDNIYGVSDRELERQRQKNNSNKKAATPASERSTRSRTSMANSGARNAMATAAVQGSRGRRDAAMKQLDALSSTTTDARDSSDVVGSPVVETGRNAAPMEASSLLGGGGSSIIPGHRAGDLSGLEINDSEIFGHLDSSFDITGDGGKGDESSGTAGQGQQSGTRSADTSTFNVSVFKRQPRRRQSSIVGRDDAPIRPSSRGPTTPGLSSTFNLGNFKRRARQPSILLSSAQKASMSVQRSRAASEASENAIGSDGEEESFLPEAEGTPVRPSRRRASVAQDIIESVEGATRSRKRKSTESHEVEAAKRQAVEADHEPLHQSIEMDDRSSPPSILSHTPELDDDSVLAPPASSSSSEAGSPMAWPSLNNLAKKQRNRAAPRGTRTPALDDDMSDISEPPSLTHSPNLKPANSAPKGKGKTAVRRESPKLSTADLAALLPRRRRKVRRDDEGSDNEGGSDQDMYGVPSEPRASRKRTARPLNGQSSKADQTNHAKATAPATKRSTRRTYGSRRFDKENTVDGDSVEVNEDASTPLDDTIFDADRTGAETQELGEELRAASKKFKEVDKWELDYEEVVESSSPLPEGR